MVFLLVESDAEAVRGDSARLFMSRASKRTVWGKFAIPAVALGLREFGCRLLVVAARSLIEVAL
jgi:hypothetical protein